MRQGKSPVAGKTQPLKAGINDFRKLEGKPPLPSRVSSDSSKSTELSGGTRGTASNPNVLGGDAGDLLSS